MANDYVIPARFMDLYLDAVREVKVLTTHCENQRAALAQLNKENESLREEIKQLKSVLTEFRRETGPMLFDSEGQSPFTEGAHE